LHRGGSGLPSAHARQEAPDRRGRGNGPSWLIDGLARDAGIFEVLSEVAPQHPRNGTFAGEVFLHPAAGAREWCGASGAEPLALSRAGVWVRQACQDLNEGPGHQGPCRRGAARN
jgi:hypothetical protein